MGVYVLLPYYFCHTLFVPVIPPPQEKWSISLEEILKLLSPLFLNLNLLSNWISIKVPLP